jgi:CRISPR type III-B/RAMP module RAMP protein Cmr6
MAIDMLQGNRGKFWHQPNGFPTQSHAGLLLDRWLPLQRAPNEDRNQGDFLKGREDLLDRLVMLGAPAGYAEHAKAQSKVWGVDRDAAGWYRGSRGGMVWRAAIFHTTSRCVVGLGQKGVLEAGISLHRTWGVPWIPGSSLKGITSAAAHALAVDPAWRRAVGDEPAGDSHAALFGTTDDRGLVTFHDALWLPPQDNKSPMLARDVMTVHHPHYYQEWTEDTQHRLRPGGGALPPDGMQSPIPVGFLSVPPGHGFLVVLEARKEDEAWLDATCQLLDRALEELGVGAKTNAGYGRFVRSGRIQELSNEQTERDAKLRERSEAERKARAAAENEAREEAKKHTWLGRPMLENWASWLSSFKTNHEGQLARLLLAHAGRLTQLDHAALSAVFGDMAGWSLLPEHPEVLASSVFETFKAALLADKKWTDLLAGRKAGGLSVGRKPSEFIAVGRELGLVTEGQSEETQQTHPLDRILSDKVPAGLEDADIERLRALWADASAGGEAKSPPLLRSKLEELQNHLEGEASPPLRKAVLYLLDHNDFAAMVKAVFKKEPWQKWMDDLRTLARADKQQGPAAKNAPARPQGNPRRGGR